MKIGRLLLRLTVGGLFIGHGTQKLLGWFGGPGLEATRLLRLPSAAPAWPGRMSWPSVSRSGNSLSPGRPPQAPQPAAEPETVGAA